MIRHPKAENRFFWNPGDIAFPILRFHGMRLIQGVPGSTVLEYAGGKHFVFAEGSEHLGLSGVTLDGGLLPISKYADAALRVNGVKRLDISRCHVTNSASSGIEVTASAGALSDTLG